MNLLTIDTSSKEIAIGIFSGNNCLFEDYVAADKNYNRVLMPIIQESMAKSGLNLGDIDIFASTLGPGSFTGIRVGMAALKGLAQPVRKKYSGAVVLDILANSSAAIGRVWAILDAGRNELYAALYGTKGKAKVLSGKYLLVTKERFLKKLKKGDTVVSLKRENLFDAPITLSSGINAESVLHIDMKVFAKIILRKAKGIKKTDLYTAAPVYIRPSEAEATLKRRKKEKIQIQRGGTR
jgi:tRNA threonylcarbamoyl adenosine modification protein YeaZ